MAIISKERTFTLEKLKRIKSLDIAYIFLVLTLILPFFLFKRAAPNYAFFAELTSAICASLFIFFASLSIKNFVIYNRLSIYLIAFSSYLVFDLIINSPVYPSLHWLYIGSLILCSLLTSTLTNFAREQGIEKVFSVVCYGLMIGGLLQDVVIFLQMLHKDWLYGWIFYINEGGAYSGNIGQRNMTAHYLSWGVLATSYLLYTNKLKYFSGYVLIIIQTLILGFVNSRTLLLYMLIITCILPIIYFWQALLPKRLFKILFVALALIFLFQLISIPTLSLIQDNSLTNSSVDRLSNNSDISVRTIEWYKAWLIFLENPFFGSGWNSYGYQGFIKSSDIRLNDINQTGSFFSHSHNIFFNLLAEIGAFGFLLIVGSFIHLLTKLLKSSWKPKTLILFLMIIISITHSMLEFPLWYSHFFLVFIAILTLLLISLNDETILTSIQPNMKVLITIVSTTYLLMSLSLYIAYNNLDKLYYRLVTDNTPEEKVITAVKMLEIGDKQPLLRAYTDIKSVDYLRLVPSEKLPQVFDEPLRRYAYYMPYPTTGIYYLITQCNNSGNWNSEHWQYYKYLSHHYDKAIPNFSIILSMTNKCPIVYEKIYKQCKEHKKRFDDKVCSMDEAIKGIYE